MGFNYSMNLYQLVLVALLSNETQDNYSKFYNILKNEYGFTPKIICCDFGLGNIGGFKKVYGEEDSKIITCFFHLTQSWWKKANSLNLRKKKFIKNTKLMIFNLQRLAFMNYDKSVKLYKNIKNRKEFSNIENYNDFFSYFEKNWLAISDKKKSKVTSSRYEFNLWNYYNKLNLEEAQSNLLLKDNMEKYIVFANNACESINSLIRNLTPLNLKVSINLFRNIIIMLFNRSGCKRTRANLDQEFRMSIKRTVSDQMIKLCNDFGSEFIE